MGRKSAAKVIQKYQEGQRNYIQSLQNSLLPGQKLLTCPYCNKICKVPEWQQEINCIKSGRGAWRQAFGTHPGEILR